MAKTKISKIAKDLNISVTTVVEFLNKKNINIDASPNTRVEDEIVEVLLKEFDKDGSLKRKMKADRAKEQGLSSFNLNEKNSTYTVVKPHTQGDYLYNNQPVMKKLVEEKYLELVELLKSATFAIENIKESNNNEIMELRGGIVTKLEELISRIKNETTHTLEAMQWDNLVIAFFGETNAGKSTIIETFRIMFDKNRPAEQDGRIVGDGRSDFTQTYSEYSLEIASKKFTLIDVPGIEGNESQYCELIHEALRKAHCVFYVQGHNKKPDEATAKKIKNYLGDWVNVYSIQNVRGGTSDYDEEEERETLLTPRVEQNEQLIHDSFVRILGDNVYKGNIPIQALLAMCANATFASERNDLKKQQKKLLSYFGSPEEILRFSQFQTIINLVEEKSGCFMEEIVESNKQKMLSLANRVVLEIDNVVEEQREQSELFQENLNLFKREVKTLFSKTKTSLKNRANGSVDSMHNNIKSKATAVLTSDTDNDNIKTKIKDCVAELNSLPGKIKQVVARELNGLTENVERKMKKTPDVYNHVKLPSFKNIKTPDITPDIQVALKELDVSLDDIGNFALSFAGGFIGGATIGSWVPGIGTIIGGTIGGIVGIISKGIASDGGKGKAQRGLDNALAKSRTVIKESVKNSIDSVIDNLSKQENHILKQITLIQDSFKEVDKIICELNNGLSNYNYKITHSEYGRISV